METRSRCLPAGWYPDSVQASRREIEEFGSYHKKFQTGLAKVNGGVVPHAGWYFSGRLAALVFNLAAASGRPDVVAVFGGHLGSGPGIIYADQAWETPLGAIEIDRELTKGLMAKVRLVPEGRLTGDNTVEIQLPLVRHYFPQSRLLALRAPHSKEALEIGRLVAEAAREQGKSVMAFGSTDLTHYGPNYGFSPKGRGSGAVAWVKNENDKGFVDLTVAMDGEGLLEHAAQNHSACSAGAAAAAVAACRALGSSRGELADYYTSYDVMPGDSFVGYAGILF
ncbi:MAG: AmmeMemoRadiSam system protein B [Thermodesulfobacteriota bacterium]